MTILFLIAAGLFGYHAHNEFGVDRTILIVLAAVCGFVALCGLVQ